MTNMVYLYVVVSFLTQRRRDAEKRRERQGGVGNHYKH